MLLLAHIITGEYAARYHFIISERNITMHNVLLCVNLVVNVMLLHYIMHYNISNALLLIVK